MLPQIVSKIHGILFQPMYNCLDVVGYNSQDCIVVAILVAPTRKRGTVSPMMYAEPRWSTVLDPLFSQKRVCVPSFMIVDFEVDLRKGAWAAERYYLALRELCFCTRKSLSQTLAELMAIRCLMIVRKIHHLAKDSEFSSRN